MRIYWYCMAGDGHLSSLYSRKCAINKEDALV